MKQIKFFSCIVLFIICIIPPCFSQREVWDLYGKEWNLPKETKIGIDQAIPIPWISFIEIQTDMDEVNTSTNIVIDLRDKRHLKFCVGWLIDQDIIENGYVLHLTHKLDNKNFDYFFDFFTSVFEEAVKTNQILINMGAKTRDWSCFDKCLSTFYSVQLIFFAEDSRYISNNGGKTYHRDDTLRKMNYWFPKDFWKNRYENRTQERVDIPKFYY